MTLETMVEEVAEMRFIQGHNQDKTSRSYSRNNEIPPKNFKQRHSKIIFKSLNCCAWWLIPIILATWEKKKGLQFETTQDKKVREKLTQKRAS
jgi:hypothetical protein